MGSSDPHVCIVGIGARTPLGRSAPATAVAVRAGVSGFREHAYCVDKCGEPMIVASASYLGEDAPLADRVRGLAVGAAGEALTALKGAKDVVHPITVSLGLPGTRPGVPAGFHRTVSEAVRTALGDTYQISGVETVLNGHAAGLMALENGSRRIRDGRADLCLVGGADSYLDVATLEWLDAEDQLHSPMNAWGFVPGEAAGFLLLAAPEAVRRLRLPILGHVLATATAREANLIKTKTVCLGQGLTQAIRQVLQVLPTPEKVHEILCDLNGEPYRADEFGFAALRTSGRFMDAGHFQTPADCWGDVGAASGPLFVTLAVAAGQKGYARGPNTLAWASSESGERSATLVRVPLQPREC